MPPDASDLISRYDIPEEVYEDYLFDRISGRELEQSEERLILCGVCCNRIHELRSSVQKLRAALVEESALGLDVAPMDYTGRERRSGSRHSTNILADVFGLAEETGSHPTPAILTNTSACGLSLIWRHSLKSGALVCIEIRARNRYAGSSETPGKSPTAGALVWKETHLAPQSSAYGSNTISRHSDGSGKPALPPVRPGACLPLDRESLRMRSHVQGSSGYLLSSCRQD